MSNIQITVHRGSHEIGGNCIELSTGPTNILLDIGLPLNGEGETPDVDFGNIDAVFISHAHLDHYGMLDNIDASTPVFCGELTKQLMDATCIFRGQEPLSNNFQYVSNECKVQTGAFTITPFLVDHSGPDAYSYLIEAGGKRVFYTGDFRAHGRKAALYHRMVENPPKDIDALIIEGTTLGRQAVEVPRESDVEASMYDVMRGESGPCFMLCSSQNIDRLVSAYRAAKRAGRLLVVDIYTAWILNQMAQHSDHTPTIEWPLVKVLSKGGTAAAHYVRMKDNPDVFGNFVRRLYDHNNVITEAELAEQPTKYLIKNSYIDRLLNNMDCEHASVIYSMWDGYLEEEYNPRGYHRFEKLTNDERVNFVKIHTSGHATPDDLKAFIEANNPGKVIPVHTEQPERYASILPADSILLRHQKLMI
jgi:ribonuclease J